MLFDSSRAAHSDRIKDTIDVRKVYAKVQSIVVHKRFYLIEAMSQHIADLILQEFNVESVTVRVRKPFAPIGGLANGTEIEITRQKSD
jgi:dihydroneopterin aldolase